MSLLTAIIAEQIDTALQLLKDKGIRDTASKNDNEALRVVAFRGQTAVAVELLKIPSVRTRAATNNNQALCYAVGNGHATIVKELLTIPAVRATAVMVINSGMLRSAATNGCLGIVRLLLEIPAVRDKIAADDNAVMGGAASTGELAVVQELFKFQAVRENAAARQNLALRSAASRGYAAFVRALLEIPAVRDNLKAMDNEAFKQAIERGHTSTVIELLTVPAARAYAGLNNNYALRVAASRGHLDIVKVLLEIPAVRDNVTAMDNEALREAVRNQCWPVVLELLKNAAVRNHLAVNDHEVLRNTFAKGEFGIVGLLLDIYSKEGISKPKDIIASFEEVSKISAVEGRSVAGMVAIVRDVFEYNGANLPSLFADERARNYAAQANNLALVFAVRNGSKELVEKLLMIQPIQDRTDAALHCAIELGHLEIVSALSKVESVSMHLHEVADEMLLRISRSENWPMVALLLHVEAVRSCRSLTLGSHELLRRAAAAIQFEVVALLMQVYKQQGRELPPDVMFTFEDGSTQNILTLPPLTEIVAGVHKDFCEAIPSHTRNILNIELAYFGCVPLLPESSPLLVLSNSGAKATAGKAREATQPVRDMSPAKKTQRFRE